MPDAGVMPERFSYSAASTFDDCPAKWRAKYVDRVEDPPGPEAELGSAVHEMLDALLGLPPWARTGPGLRRAVATVGDRYPLGVRRVALTMVSTAARTPVVGSADVVAREVRAETTLEGVPFLGIVDLVERLPSGALAVTDWKTGKRPAPRFAEGPHRQVQLYAAAVAGVFAAPVWAARLGWLRSGRVDDVPVDEWSVAGAVEWLAGVWEELGVAVRDGVFEERPGPLCSWCPAVAGCGPGLAAVRERAAAGKRIGEHGQAALQATEVER